MAYFYVSDNPPEYRPKKLSMKSTVKILGYNFGYITLFRILKEIDILDQSGSPYEQYTQEGYFSVDFHEMQKGFVHWQTYILGQKGLEFVKKMVDEYLAENPIPKGKRRKKKGGDDFILIDDTKE